MHHCNRGVASENIFANPKQVLLKWKGDLADVW